MPSLSSGERWCVAACRVLDWLVAATTGGTASIVHGVSPKLSSSFAASQQPLTAGKTRVHSCPSSTHFHSPPTPSAK
eukprot:5367520-Prymnesium_polylepis.1